MIGRIKFICLSAKDIESMAYKEGFYFNVFKQYNGIAHFS